MKLTKEEALRYHRQMWTDMQKELGNCPSAVDRALFKEEWCEKHFSGERISNHCFLCEYTEQNDVSCKCCPIEWTIDEYGNCTCSSVESNYRRMFISDLLALPEREDEKD